MQLKVAETRSFKPAVKIVQMQKANDPDSSYTPSPGAEMLWLREGDYQATLVCLRNPGDSSGTSTKGVPLDADGYFNFTMEPQIDPKWKVEYSFYQLDCTIGTDGKPSFLIDPVIEITGD
jgi:hypothetical protein